MADPSRPPRSGERDAARPQYKGDDLDAARGPGLGCFYVQVVLLVAFVVLTPVSAFAGWNPAVTLVLMIATIVLLLLVGQTVIFLLRIVAAERGQRRPLASRTRTVGEIESGRAAPETAEPGGDDEASRADRPGVRE